MNAAEQKMSEEDALQVGPEQKGKGVRTKQIASAEQSR
jgi:hypothetical protein